MVEWKEVVQFSHWNVLLCLNHSLTGCVTTGPGYGVAIKSVNYNIL